MSVTYPVNHNGPVLSYFSIPVTPGAMRQVIVPVIYTFIQTCILPTLDCTAHTRCNPSLEWGPVAALVRISWPEAVALKSKDRTIPTVVYSYSTIFPRWVQPRTTAPAKRSLIYSGSGNVQMYGQPGGVVPLLRSRCNDELLLKFSGD